jgi:hypothetical protein
MKISEKIIELLDEEMDDFQNDVSRKMAWQDDEIRKIRTKLNLIEKVLNQHLEKTENESK